MLMLLVCSTCYAKSNEYTYSFELDRSITNVTSEFFVIYDNSGCVINPEYKNASLFITANEKTLYQQKCTKNNITVGFMDVKIPKQKAGTKIRIYLEGPGFKSNVRSIRVKDINSILPGRRTKKVSAPKLITKNNNTYIRAKKGQTIVVRNSKKVVKTIPIANKTYINLGILDKYREKRELYVYAKYGKNYSKKYLVLPRIICINE